MRIRRAMPAIAVALALGVTPVGAAETAVSIEDFDFVAPSVTVALGDSVRWTNEDGSTHTSTGKAPLGLWNLSIPGGADRARTFSYLIERKKPGGSFKAWKTTSARSTTFQSSVVGTWTFRVKLRRNSTGATSGVSPVDTAVIT